MRCVMSSFWPDKTVNVCCIDSYRASFSQPDGQSLMPEPIGLFFAIQVASRGELDMLVNADDRFRRHIRCAEQFEPTLLAACG